MRPCRRSRISSRPSPRSFASKAGRQATGSEAGSFGCPPFASPTAPTASLLPQSGISQRVRVVTVRQDRPSTLHADANWPVICSFDRRYLVYYDSCNEAGHAGNYSRRSTQAPAVAGRASHAAERSECPPGPGEPMAGRGRVPDRHRRHHRRRVELALRGSRKQKTGRNETFRTIEGPRSPDPGPQSFPASCILLPLCSILVQTRRARPQQSSLCWRRESPRARSWSGPGR